MDNMNRELEIKIEGADLDPKDEFAVFKKWEKEAFEELEEEE